MTCSTCRSRAATSSSTRPSPANPVLKPENPNQPAYLIVTFPPQTVAEQAFYESAPSNPPAGEKTLPFNAQHPPATLPTLPVQARIGKASRLVFRIPAGSKLVIPYTTAGVLDWQQLELAVSQLADVPAEPTPAERQNAPAISQPGALETAIELPYRLILSPNHAVAWQHALQPKTVQGVTELWHTRMALKDTDGTLLELTRARTAPLRAIWSPDFNPAKFVAADTPVFAQPDSDWGVLTPMTPSDRHELVILTSAFHGFVKDKTDLRDYEPLPINAEQVILSPLGGWLKSRGTWDPPAPFRPFIFVDPVFRYKWDAVIRDLGKLRSMPNIPRGLPPLKVLKPKGETVPEEFSQEADLTARRLLGFIHHCPAE